MNGRDKRKKRATRGIRDPWGGQCPNGCGGPGPHFVPPSLGDRGFYICEPTAAVSTSKELEHG